MPFLPPCPPNTKPKGDIPTVFSDPAAQDWFSRNNGRDVEAARPVGDDWLADLRRLGAGFVRQYHRLPQGGRWQKVRAALDRLRTAAEGAETQTILKMRKAFNALNPEQRHRLGSVLLARDLDEEVRIQKNALSVEEQARLDTQIARMERADTKARKALEKTLVQQGRELTDTRDTRARRAQKLAAQVTRLEKQQEAVAEKRKAAKPGPERRALVNEGRRVQRQISLAKKKLRAEEARVRQAERALTDYPATVQKRTQEFDRRAEARVEAATRRFRTEVKLAHATGVKLPDGLTEAQVVSMMKDAEATLASDPAVREAFDARRTYMRETVDELKRLHRELFGFEPDLNREEYFHHQVLLHAMEEGGKKGGGRVRAPLNAFYLKRRKGSTLAYNTNFFESEQRVMGRMLGDVQTLRALAAIKEHDVSARVMQEGLAARKAGEKADFQKFVPEGYVRWSPARGATIAKFWNPRDFMLDRLEQAGYERLGLTEGQNKQDFYNQEMSSWVIPEELAATLDDIVGATRGRYEDLIRRIVRLPVRGFKVTALYSPDRVLRYIEGNIAGDTHAAFLYTSPRRWANLSKLFSARALPEVTADLISKGKGKVSPEYEAFLERSGRGSTQLKSELGLGVQEKKGIARIREVFVNEPSLVRSIFFGTRQALYEPMRWYLNQAMGGDGARERLWRYTLFLDYLDQIQKSPDGRPRDWGTSIPDEVLAYDNLYDRAYHMSNDTMGAYDKTTEAGRVIAEHVAPFWRYQELNHRRAYRYAVNQAGSTEQAARLGNRVLHAMGQAAKATPLVAARVGFFAAKVTALEAALQAYNYTQYPDLEESLPEDVRSRPHLILGYDARTGEAQYLGKLGAIPDFYALFGLFDNYKFGQAWLNGEMSSRDAIVKMYDKTAETFGKSIGPWKQVPQIVSGVKELPGGKTAPIRDTADHAIGQFLGPTAQRWYRGLKEMPQPGYDVRKHAVTVTNAWEQAYHQTMERMDDFQRKGRGLSAQTPAATALYWHRQARRFGDAQLAEKYAFEYIKEGGDAAKGYVNTAKALAPIRDLNAMQLGKWLGTLELREKRNVLRAMQHWGSLFAPGFDIAAEVEGDMKDAPKEVRDAVGHGPRSLRRLMAPRELRDEATLKEIDERLSILLPYLRGMVLGEAAMDNKVMDTLLARPGAIDTMIERRLEKAGIE